MSYTYRRKLRCVCERCGHVWDARSEGKLPRKCASRTCGALSWNESERRKPGPKAGLLKV